MYFMSYELDHTSLDKLAYLAIKRGVSLQKGQNIELRGFGTISRKINKEKIVRNPKTKEKLFKNKSFKLHFKIGKVLHRKINGFTNSHIEDEV